MTHGDYATFVFIVKSEEPIDVEELEYHDWPEGIKCFFSPRSKPQRY